MTTRNIVAAGELLSFFNKSSAVLYAILENLPVNQFVWSPAPESRSIQGMVRHLMRVDIWFMKEFGISLETQDPGETDPETTLAALKGQHREIAAILAKPELNWALRLDGHKHIRHSFAEVVFHMCQHYLYHHAQMLYLRRAQDRNWTSNIADWEKVTYQMGADSQFVTALQQQERVG